LSSDGLLYRLCDKHAAELVRASDHDFFAKIASRARLAPSTGPGWTTAILFDLEGELRAPREKLLVACSAVLKALDEHHQDEHPYPISKTIPEELGGWRTVFLPQPVNWIATQDEARSCPEGRRREGSF
jgi:hypothetical protein